MKREVNVSYFIYDEVIKGRYVKKSIEYQLDNEHMVEMYDVFIAIEQITDSYDEG